MMAKYTYSLLAPVAPKVVKAEAPKPAGKILNEQTK